MANPNARISLSSALTYWVNTAGFNACAILVSAMVPKEK